MRKIIVLGGPTASGKSALALKWAQENNGEIINGDSMQIYRELDIITACPTKDEMKQVPHHLYRTLKGDDPCSAERWREMARAKLDDIWGRDKTPIVVGGTGLYLKALVMGLSKVPDIDPKIREDIRQSVLVEGPVAAHERLSSLDPEMASRLAPADGQRISRALEVILSTKRSLSLWQAEPEVGGLKDQDVDMSLNVIERDRAELYDRCNERFKMMIEQGDVIEEVRSLMEHQYALTLPVMKSLGVPQIIDHIDGKLSKEEAITLSQTATRQFAKRQMTWFRNQFSSWEKHFL